IVSNEVDLSLKGLLEMNNVRLWQTRTAQLKATAQDLEEGDYDVWVVVRSDREGAQWVKVHGSTTYLTERSYIPVKVFNGEFILGSVKTCKLDMTITTTATKTINYWVYDNYSAELTKGQALNKKASIEILQGVDYTFKFYELGYDTATVRVNVMQDTSIEVRLKEKMLPPYIYLANVLPETNNVRFLWQKQRSSTTPDVSPLSYILYLDSVPVATAGVYTGRYGEYIFENVSVGEHMFSVRSVYTDDTSEMVSKTLDVPEGAANETLSASDCKIYPNPSASGLFTLEVGQACRMQVSSVTGKILYEDNFVSAGQYTIPLQGYAAGMYIVRLFTEDNQSVLLKAFIR
ncbi:MAG: T9SS type A sorting domain-containing protein, partial [Bacteroidales bacterium]|nr:T9SS type A sorting domain-containing protein [Bacteroidales bacterium]